MPVHIACPSYASKINIRIASGIFGRMDAQVPNGLREHF